MIRRVDLVLFGSVAFLWSVNLTVMLYKKRVHNTIITGLLYGIIALIIISRLMEVSEVKAFEQSNIVLVTGILATYGKICLGCCQLSAMFQIKAQLKGHLNKLKQSVG